MSDLIHKIVGKIIEVGQSDTAKFRLGEIIRYSPSEILEILKQHESEIFGEGSSTQSNDPNTLNALNLIDREAAIDALSMTQGIVAEEGVRKGISLAWQQIKDLPSAQPEPKWIPCSERPPEVENNVAKRVIVTTSWNMVCEAHYCVDHWEMNDIDYKLSSVIAWMPLPEPYKEGKA